MTLPLAKAVLLAGAASLLAPLGAQAQDVRDLDNQRSDVLIFEGEVTTTPVRFSYTVPPRTALQVDVIPNEGSELDPMVTITDARSGEVLAEDDDSGGNLASRARIVSERGQRVEITVSSFAFLSGEETAGGFELQLRPTAWRPPSTTAVTLGSSTQGTLAAGASQLFTIEGRKGQVLEVALVARGEGLDPYLTLYQGRGTDGEMLTSDDDGGNELNSMIRHTLTADGTYTIEATPYGDTSGDFTLRVRGGEERPAMAGQQVLGLGDTHQGYVRAAYEELSEEPGDGKVTYSLSPQAIAAIRAGSGQVTINMTAPAFEDPDFPSGIDPYLEIGFETPLGFASMLSDDDGGGSLNARLAVDLAPLASAGDWLERLRVRASSIGGAGAFDIAMAEGLQEVETPAYMENVEAEAEAAVDDHDAPPMVQVPVPQD